MIIHSNEVPQRTCTIEKKHDFQVVARRFTVIAKFHYTDTDTGPTRTRHGHGHGLFCGETPLGPCGSVRVRVRVRVRVVEFSYNGIVTRLRLKINWKSYVLYQMVTLRGDLSSTQLHQITTFEITLERAKLDPSNLVHLGAY